jgi:hypothetical protein
MALHLLDEHLRGVCDGCEGRETECWVCLARPKEVKKDKSKYGDFDGEDVLTDLKTNTTNRYLLEMEVI